MSGRAHELFIGLMSGTSIDAIDAVLVEIGPCVPKILATHSEPLTTSLRDRILAVAEGRQDDLASCARLDRILGQVFADAVLALLAAGGVTNKDILAIGSHGQTVRHRPDADPPYTVQFGDPATIATRTGIDVVADLRRHDIAAGGQGAPLVPAFHAAIWRCRTHDRIVVNIGGMSNISWLPAAREDPVGGFDCGPGNVLLDGWIRRCRGASMDRDGAWAGSGRVVPALLAQMLSDPFLHQPPPRSTGRERFNMDWLDEQIDRAGVRHVAEADIQATLAEFTAAIIVDAIDAFAPVECGELIVCGGGAYNRNLLARISSRLGAPVRSSEALGLEPRWVEACAMAWLARETLAGRPGNLPEVTGADRPLCLGGIYRGG